MSAEVANATKTPTASGSFQRRLVGTVSSDKMDKTIVVDVVRFKMHAMYKKYVRVRKKYKAHDEHNQFHTGDRVEITEYRPMSKEKRFKATRLVERGVEE